MKCRKYQKRTLILMMIAAFLLTVSPAQAYYSGFESAEECDAYQAYKQRPNSEYSKIVYLIDRFADSKMQILYDGHYFDAPFVGKVSRWFLARKYRNESAKDWIMKWCNTSIGGGSLIWVKIPERTKFMLSREILIKELEQLEELDKKNSHPDPAVVSLNESAILPAVTPVAGSTDPSSIGKEKPMAPGVAPLATLTRPAKN